MDAIKRAVAENVQVYLVGDRTYNWPELPIEKIEYTRVDALNTMVRVVKKGHGVRYFNVKVTENV